MTIDGKFPLYLTFVDRQVARAITQAVAGLEPVGSVRAMRTNPTESPGLRGLQVRTRCRPPWLFDQELRALSFADSSGKVKATLINWGTHPESLEDGNTQISSDFIHYIRDEVETRIGGTAVYLSADLGAVEITGDTCVGGADARNPDGTNEFDMRTDLGFARTERIGRAVGGVAAERLLAAAPLAVASLDVKTVNYRASSSNPLFELGRMIGVLDLDPVLYDPSLCPGASGLCAPLEQTAIAMRDRAGQPLVQMITTPGELFPELYLGVATHRRTDCPAADTGRPPEPSIRDAMVAPYRLVIGLSPDEIGYVVPGYDFYPATNLLDETPDPCVGQAYDPAHPQRHVPTHYHETLSVGVEAASLFTCKAVELLGGGAAIVGDAACAALP
jgi:hypothetical protein